MSDRRPDPEQLLARVQKEERQENKGRLKIYLGAAPGVGKTHEMLHDAMQKRAHGLDVIIGIAESHGRKEIERLLNNFEVLPRQTVSYRDKELLEFDLDAALQRHPGLILVDEMAHTNAPGLRHAKRWQDIQELLERGIDVYTTLNVQHIESLNDDVAQIIQALIYETVPDTMIEKADTIELVDLPPEDLLTRLQEGKVYLPVQAKLAKESFFRIGNLIALRELALRITAEHVGTEVLWHRQGEGIKVIWPVKAKILVCVGPRPESLELIRATKRLATGLQAEWLAVYIDTPQHANEEKRNEAIQNLHLAELLGAQPHVLSGFDIVKELIHFAQQQNITQIVIRKQITTRWRGWFRRNLADEIVRNSGEIDVYIMTRKHNPFPVTKKNKKKTAQWKSYASAVGVVTLTTLISCFFFGILTSNNLVMFYLLGITIVALWGQAGPSLLASILSALAYDFFFIQPYYSFAVSDIEYLFTLLVMLIVAQVISYLTLINRRQAESARLNQYQANALYAFSRKLTTARGVDKILALGIEQLNQTFHSHLMVFLPQNHRLTIQASYPSPLNLSDKEFSIAQWVFDMKRPAGQGTETLASSDALYLPLIGSSETQGVIRVKPEQLFSPEQRGLLESCINQLALILEVARLQEKSRVNELEIEKDRAQTALLASIFRDLCFPLTQVINTLHDLKEVGQETMARYHTEYEINKLNRLNNNLYHIIQLETNGTELTKEPCSLSKLINTSIKIANNTLEKRTIELTIADNLPLISLDSKLIQETLLHLLDNAIKFSPRQSPIYISVHELANKVKISIKNSGSEVLPDESNKLFKKFYRGEKILAEHGLGLGLAICDKIISAHQGIIWFEDLDSKETTVSFTLPLDTVP